MSRCRFARAHLFWRKTDSCQARVRPRSSGIDLALRVVERYYGRDIARQTAYNMEYQGQGWMNADSNQVYATASISTAEHPLCPVCGMDVDPATAPKSVFKGKTYLFCSDDDKKTFDAAPDKFAALDKGS